MLRPLISIGGGLAIAIMVGLFFQYIGLEFIWQCFIGLCIGALFITGHEWLHDTYLPKKKFIVSYRLAKKVVSIRRYFRILHQPPIEPISF